MELKFTTAGATTRKDGAFTTGDSTENGIGSPFAFDASKGATVAFSARRDDSIAGGNWNGDLFSFGSAFGLPVDGLQVEGPNKNFAGYSYRDTAYPRCQERFAVLQHYADVHFAIAMDEPVVSNMANTMFVFGLLAK